MNQKKLSFKITFNYNSNNYIINCNSKDTFVKVTQSFSKQAKLDINKVQFLYNGNSISNNLTIDELSNQIDKKRKEMNIVVNIRDNTASKEKEKNIKHITEIICPECHENIFFKIENYKINLFDCINNHKINNILLNEFKNTQKNYISCNICKIIKKRKESKFFRCLKCKSNLCNLCMEKHNKEHKIINYNIKSFICNEHHKTFSYYCKICKKDICESCLIKHKQHDLINFGDASFDMEDLTNNINSLKMAIDKLTEKINEIIK